MQHIFVQQKICHLLNDLMLILELVVAQANTRGNWFRVISAPLIPLMVKLTVCLRMGTEFGILLCMDFLELLLVVLSNFTRRARILWPFLMTSVTIPLAPLTKPSHMSAFTVNITFAPLARISVVGRPPVAVDTEICLVTIVNNPRFEKC